MEALYILQSRGSDVAIRTSDPATQHAAVDILVIVNIHISTMNHLLKP